MTHDFIHITFNVIEIINGSFSYNRCPDHQCDIDDNTDGACDNANEFCCSHNNFSFNLNNKKVGVPIMISSFEKYIKAAIDAKKYSVVCEMANIVHSDKNRINIMTYPGKDVRVYKNRDDEVQILCPKNISYVQESNLTKAISTGTIFDNADDVNKYAGFIVKTKMPIDAMTNKGLENPYKLREVVGSTIGVMNEDGEVDVSDADVDNGNNIIDDLLKKDSKEFKDVKNVVDDYLDNDDHSFGYDTDFTYDIQQLRDEINRFKDADIAPEDSITDADWDDNWGSTSSIMGDHTDAEDEENEDDDLKRSHADDDLDIADDDDEDENPENITQESYSISSPAYKMNPNHKAAFLNTDDDDIDNDTDVSYNMKKECGDGSISLDPSSGGNVNTAMEDGDTTTPMPAFSSGSGTDIQTESDEVDEEPDDPEYKVKFVKSKGNLRDKDNNAEECLAKLKELVHGDIPEDYIEGIMNAEAKDLMNKYSNGIIEVPDFDEFIVSGLCPIDEVVDYNESMPDRFSDDCSVFIVGTSDYDMRFIVLDTNDGKYYLVYMDYHGNDGFFKYPIASSFKELIEVLEKAKALDDERWDELIRQSKEKVGESFTPKAVVPDDLDTTPSDGHNPLLSPIHEGFMMKRPKKLKAIDIRGIVSYVTIEMNDIKDANDQAMIAGYVCSKLELIDFYITVLDTHDDRYVVPHTRQYLVDGQRQLSDLLTRILKIRPINRADRIWQIEKII